MLRSILSAIIIALFAQSAAAQNEIPDSCLDVTNNPSDDLGRWKPCWDEAEPQSNIWYLATINLGTGAFYKGDFEEAAKYYLMTAVEGKKILSDVILHAHRASVFTSTGNLDEAKYDAEFAWAFVKTGSYGLGDQSLSLDGQFYVLIHILEALNDTDSSDFEMALEYFKSIETTDIYDRVNRAALLSNVGDIDAAILESEAVLQAMPDNAGVQNNHCDMLTRADRAEEGLPLCEKAVAQNPEIAAFQHSFAAALAAVGRCDEAEAAISESLRLQPSKIVYQEELGCKSQEDD